MRHQKRTIKLGRKAEHRKALLANQVVSLITHRRIKTTLAKAKAVRPLADKMVTLGKRGSIHARRTAFSALRQKDAVKKLFDEIAPRSTNRSGGYTRIVRLGQRRSDSAPMAFLEWVDVAPVMEEEKPAQEKKSKRKEAESKAQGQETKAEVAKAEPAEIVPAQEKEAPPAEESKLKKRKWFGRKTKE